MVAIDSAGEEECWGLGGSFVGFSPRTTSSPSPGIHYILLQQCRSPVLVKAAACPSRPRPTRLERARSTQELPSVQLLYSALQNPALTSCLTNRQDFHEGLKGWSCCKDINKCVLRAPL